ncbi:MAG: hypothetical protein CM15mP120_01610 [Pseudomonadota bacterium]|nr:MAG: hypothetical protein CM15mP120_01610 [Pseudomonadota bacterium]
MKVTLRITAQYATEWNVWGTVETLKHKMQILDQHCTNLVATKDDSALSSGTAVYERRREVLARGKAAAAESPSHCRYS